MQLIVVLFPSLFIKGSDDAHVVMCSNSSTFELKEAETSNSLLLMPSLAHSTTIEQSNSRTLKEQEVSAGFFFLFCISFNFLDFFLRFLVSITLIMR